MSNGFTIRVQDLDKSLKSLKLIEKKVAVGLRKNLDDFGISVVRGAVSRVPIDEGHLKNTISYAHTIQEKGFGIEIIVAANYAAYMEFGTRGYAAKEVAKLPPDWQAFAAKFRGGGGAGSIDEFIKRIHEWVLRKGFAAYKTKSGKRSESKNSLQAQESAAYIIVQRILQNGVKAHPFLYPAYVEAKKDFIAALKKL